MCCSDALAVTEPDRELATIWLKLFMQRCGALLPQQQPGQAFGWAIRLWILNHVMLNACLLACLLD